MIKTLFSYNDDNHDTQYWLDKRPIGSLEEPEDLLIAMYNIGKKDNQKDIKINSVKCYISDIELKTVRDYDFLHNYLCFPVLINDKVWKKLEIGDFQGAVDIIKSELC